MAGALPQSGVSLIAQNAGQFVSQMSGAEKALGAFGKGAGAMSNIVTGAFRQVGAIITNVLAGAIREVGQWVGESLSVAGDFQETLNIMGATSGATAAQLDQVAAKAKELGADLELPTTSANDAAEVMLELSKAGLDVQESMDAAKGALLLAAAADTDSATATGILTGALNAFGLEATEATRIADLLAAGANASSASMTDLGQGLQQAGAIAHAAGMPVEDLITSLAALTNVGYTGSDAGTALKNAMTRLINPTDKAAKLMAQIGFNAYDAQGKMKPFPQLLSELNQSLAGMTDEQRNAALSTIFLSDGMKAMIPLLALGEDGFLALKDQVTEQGAAADVARARMQGWNGALASAKSQLENLQLTVGQFLIAALTPMVTQLGIVIGQISAFADAMLASGDPIGFLITQIDQVLPGFQGMVSAIGQVVAILLGGLPSGTSIAQAALTAIRDVLVNLVIPAITQAATWLAANLPAAIAAAKGAIDILTGAFTAAQTLIATDLGMIQSVATRVFGTLQTYIPAVMYAIQSIIGAVLTQVLAFWNAHGTEIMAFVQTTWATISTIIDTALQIILGIVTGVLAGLADFINNHGQEIQTILSGAWQMISNIITGVLAVIQGILQAALAVMQGDWQGAWEAIRTMSETFVKSIWGVIKGFIDLVAGFFSSSMADIGKTWEHNWNAMVSLLEGIPGRVAGVGGAIVSAIKEGFSRAWNGFIADVKAKLAEMRAMLPFSEPKDKSSPLYGLPKSGKAIVGMLQAGIDAAPPLTLGRETARNIPAAPVPASAGATTNTTYGNSYTMPIYTNQSPAVLSQGLALAEAVSR